MRFNTKFSEYELIQTQDGSWAIYSDFYNENSHSLVGARSETEHNFIQGCQLDNKIQKNSEITLLEVGFGIGNGLATTLDFWKKSKKQTDHFTFISQEIDPELVQYSFAKGPYANELNCLHRNDEWAWTLVEGDKKFEVKILSGDARHTIKSLKDDSLDAIFQDAYSPGKNPDLWTLEWFSDLYSCANQECIMATYSASARIRKAMVEAGWFVTEKKGFGSKRSMSIVYRSQTDDSLNEKISNSKVKSLTDLSIQITKDN